MVLCTNLTTLLGLLTLMRGEAITTRSLCMNSKSLSNLLIGSVRGHITFIFSIFFGFNFLQFHSFLLYSTLIFISLTSSFNSFSLEPSCQHQETPIPRCSDSRTHPNIEAIRQKRIRWINKRKEFFISELESSGMHLATHSLSNKWIWPVSLTLTQATEGAKKS